MQLRKFVCRSFSVVSIATGLLFLLFIGVDPFVPISERSQPFTISAAQAIQSVIEQTIPDTSTNSLPGTTGAAPVEDSVVPSIILSDARIADVHQFAFLESLSHAMDSNQVDVANTLQSANPYLLADYAAQCKAYMGTVPEFSCTDPDHPNVAASAVLTVDVTKGICPHLGNDPNCVISGTVEGRLTPPIDAPAGVSVTMLFSCRKYDTRSPAGRFDDIAVIQHDKTTGNTCWYQTPTVFEFNDEGNYQQDEQGYVIFKDWPGELVPSPMDYGAHNFWLHPYHPNDLIGRNFLNDMRAGRRGIVANMDCQRCHDADPFIWTPYLATVHVINGSTPPEGWNPTGNYVSNFLGLFNADGKLRPQARRFNPIDNPCAGCHDFGENVMSRNDVIPPRAHDSPVVHLLELLNHDMVERNNPWMPPVTSTGFAVLTTTTKELLHNCAATPTATGCNEGLLDLVRENGGLPLPAQRANLTLNVTTDPAILIAGHTVNYTIRLKNIFTFSHTASGLQIIDTLPVGVTPRQIPDGCTSITTNGVVKMTCTIGDLGNNQEKIIAFVADVNVTSNAETLTNTVEVTTTKSTDSLNIETIQALNVNYVRRNADLALRQAAFLEAVVGANPATYRLKYTLTVANKGPAVAADVVLTQRLPEGATYDAGLSSLQCTENAGLVTCNLGELHDGGSSAINLLATVPAASYPLFINTVHVAAASADPNLTNNTLIDVVFDRAVIQQQFLPLVMRPGPRGPDLVVNSIQITPETAQVVIQNIGDVPMASEHGFWVDLYINPNPLPSGVNQTVEMLKTNGVVWGVLTPTVQLAPGEEYTLHVGDAHFVRQRSSIPYRIEAGSLIVVQVDSANVGSDNGGVLEDHELYGESYNNISSMTLSETVSTSQWQFPPAASLKAVEARSMAVMRP